MEWYLLVLFSGVLFGLSSVIRKKVLFHEHALEQIVAQAPFHIVFLIVLFQFITPLPWQIILIIYVFSWLLLTTMLYRNKSYRHLPISTVAPMMSFSPVILLLFAVFFLGEKVSIVQLYGILLLIVGGYLIELRSKEWFLPLKRFFRDKNMFVLFITLVLLSLLATIDKLMLQEANIPVLSYLFYMQFFMTINAMACHLYIYRWRGVLTDIRKGWYWLSIISFLAIANVLVFFQALAIPGVLIALAVPLRRFGILVEVVLGGQLFHEDGVWRKTLASLVMIAGILLIV